MTGELYFLKRHGQYFRPGAHGYTNDILAAGIFDHETAHGYENIDSPPVEIIPIKDARVHVADILKRSKEAVTKCESLMSTMDKEELEPLR